MLCISLMGCDCFLKAFSHFNQNIENEKAASVAFQLNVVNCHSGSF